MATTRSVLGCEVSSWCTEREAKELERLGFTVGFNGAYLLGSDGAPGYYVWPAAALPGTDDSGYFADPGRGVKSSAMVPFDDLMAAARYLLVEVSNGA